MFENYKENWGGRYFAAFAATPLNFQVPPAPLRQQV